MNNKIILPSPNYNILKIRVANSGNNQGKRGSFRLIAAANRSAEEIILLYVYPKVGSQKKSNISDEFRDDLLRNLIVGRKNGDLIPMDIDNKLVEILNDSAAPS